MILFANQLPEWLGAIFALFVIVGMGCGALYFYRGFERLAKWRLKRKLRGLGFREDTQEVSVFVSYNTYHGFVAWYTETMHEVWLPYSDARKLLGRLFRFNLSWGFFTWGILFLIPSAIAHFISARSSIDKQFADKSANDGFVQVREGVATFPIVSRILSLSGLLLFIAGIALLFLHYGMFGLGCLVVSYLLLVLCSML